ncbi:MAG: FKBP-type peptidyl-prolyl cis-trans isomerase [Ignavibacteria bacterium]|jgi:FKBP-type peptidyl-prolyl cis-trans isomerase
MKYLLIAVFLFATSCAQSSKQDLTTKKDSVSYSIGHSLGQNIKAQNLDMEIDILVKGLKDGIKGGSGLLTDEEMTKIIIAFQQEQHQKQKQKTDEEKKANLEAGNKFLAENKTKEGVIALPSGLQYKVIKEGTGSKPKKTDKVKVNYMGTLIDGTEFDNSYKRGEPISFELGSVIKGWTEGLQLMPVGSKYMFYIPANLAYGENRRSEIIGPNACLIFEVELLEIEK